MPFRPFSVVVGVGQAIVIYFYLHVLARVAELMPDDWELTGTVLIVLTVVALLGAAAIALAYPVHLFRRGRKADAIVVFASTLLSFLGSLAALVYIIADAFSAID